MKPLTLNESQEVVGGLAPLAWFLIALASTYATCAVGDSEHLESGVNAGAGTCDDPAK